MTSSRNDDTNPGALSRRVSFRTLGCKLNQAESDAIAALFQKQGYEVVPFRQEADVTLINTCAVTLEADAKSRQAIRQAILASPHGRVIAAGCFAQIKPEEAAGIEGVDMVLGTYEKCRVHELLILLEGRRSHQPLICVGDNLDQQIYDETPYISATSRARAFLKIQEGCDYNCSYCIVPFARGRSRSRPLDDCLAEARRLVAGGLREIVLTGVNIGTWETNGLKFQELLSTISDINGLQRIRLSSIEPNLITEDLIQLVADRDIIAPHFHIPLQHASDRILKAMRRRYLFADYRAVLERIVNAIPDAAIGTDVIVGFPGEKEADFQLLAQALTDLPFTYHHIFRYSERDGTVASQILDGVDPAVRKERSAILREISRNRRQEVIRQSVGQTRSVHLESCDHNGGWEGLTDNYLRVQVPLPRSPRNPIIPVRLTGYRDLVLHGRHTK